MINFLVLGLVTFIGGAVLERNILFKLAYFFLLFHLIIKYYHYNIAKNLKIEHYLKSDHLFYQEEIEIMVEVENNSFLPILWFKFEEYLPGDLTAREEQHLSYFKAGEKKQWQFNLKAKKRGLYKVGPLKWQLGDFLGYQLTKGELAELEFYVYPKILNLEELGLASRLPFGNSKWPQPIYKDPYRNSGIREYQASDRLNQIHWKATAKTSELKSRKNESTVSIETALILNMSQKDYDLKNLETKTELAVTAAASFAYYLNRAGHSFKFLSNADLAGEKTADLTAFQKEKYLELPAAKGEAHLQQLLEILARVEISKFDNFFNLLTNKLELSWGGTLIIFTNKDDKDLMQLLNNLRRRGFNIKIMIMGEQVIHKQYLHRPQTAALSSYHLRREGDLNESQGI